MRRHLNLPPSHCAGIIPWFREYTKDITKVSTASSSYGLPCSVQRPPLALGLRILCANKSTCCLRSSGNKLIAVFSRSLRGERRRVQCVAGPLMPMLRAIVGAKSSLADIACWQRPPRAQKRACARRRTCACDAG